MVIHLLKGEGFHPLEWADMPGPYIGPIGMARVIVPPEESQAAKQFLVSLKDGGFRIEDMEGAGEDEEDEEDEEDKE